MALNPLLLQPRSIAVVGASEDVSKMSDPITVRDCCLVTDGAAAVATAAASRPGGVAVNTNGGGLSCVHPGMYGLFTMVEAVEQVRGTAGARQVEGAQLAIAHGNGGVFSSQATVIFGTESTL